MKVSEAAELVRHLKAAFPRQELSGETLEVYCKALADLDVIQTAEAIRRIIGTSRFFPTIAEIRTVVAEAQTQLPSVEEAWEEVRRSIQSVGYYREPKFSHEVIARAVDCIGWKTLCHSEAIGVERAHFFKAYEGARERAVTEANVGKLERPRRAEVLQLVEALADAKTLKDPA